MKLNFKDKSAFVCGGSRGIGRATAIALAKSGCNVYLLARNEDKLQETINELDKNENQKHSYLVADLQETDILQKKVDDFIRDKGIDILINNSNGPLPKDLLKAEPKDFRKFFEQFFIANQLIVQCVTPHMKYKKYGRIINVLGTTVKAPIPGLGLSIIKAPVANWAKALSKELGSDGITVNNVLPGPTDTRELSNIIKILSEKEKISWEEFLDNVKQDISLKRVAKPKEIANAIIFLASEQASFITGTNFTVDGGYTDTL